MLEDDEVKERGNEILLRLDPLDAEYFTGVCTALGLNPERAAYQIDQLPDPE